MTLLDRKKQRTLDLLGVCSNFPLTAAQMIIGLEDKIDELEEQTRWIPVSERLPDREGYYIVWMVGVDGGNWSIGYFSAAGFTVSEWWEITHWRAGPPAPEQKVSEE